MKGAVLMVQGTASNVGKSLIVTGLCRLLSRRGLKVAPFKAQNLSLNSSVTADGGEMGRAQVTQAQAAGIEPTVDMNPILLKPEAGSRQAIVLGKPYLDDSGGDPRERRRKLSEIVEGCLDRLRAEYDVVLIEGAGSPAEINLRERDIANMHVALLAQAPVILVGDIDRGGVFAHLVGTLELLEPEERALVQGLVINQFRGDPALLYDANAQLEARTGTKVVGVVPHVDRLRIPDEDAVALDHRRIGEAGKGLLDIAVVRYPRISNFDDFLALEHEPSVRLRYVEEPQGLEGADLVILPGTKDTRSDLRWLRQAGFDAVLHGRAKAGKLVLGICGGYQMLGEGIDDPVGAEGEAGSEPGLGLLPVRTTFQAAKTTAQVKARINADEASFLLKGAPIGELLQGYEIHMGQVEATEPGPWMFTQADGRGEGRSRGSVAGTLMHGLLDNDGLRAGLLQHLAQGRGIASSLIHAETVQAEFDRLADVLEENLDVEFLLQLLEASQTGDGHERSASRP